MISWYLRFINGLPPRPNTRDRENFNSTFPEFKTEKPNIPHWLVARVFLDEGINEKINQWKEHKDNEVSSSSLIINCSEPRCPMSD